ncbi:helix-turn-helix transcriptional regulator [Candidatus Kapabacteria bacterium]|nr:helix-turn-helix transcriptional regulator [Candidatus Kapabacteria bacterium]
MTLIETFGIRLKQERELRGYTANQMAFFLNVSTTHLLNVEKGTINPKLELIEGLVKQGVDIKSMFKEIDDEVVTGMIFRKGEDT